MNKKGWNDETQQYKYVILQKKHKIQQNTSKWCKINAYRPVSDQKTLVCNYCEF